MDSQDIGGDNKLLSFDEAMRARRGQLYAKSQRPDHLDRLQTCSRRTGTPQYHRM
jgi:hypothetical protein